MNFSLCIFAILFVLFCVPECKSDTIYKSSNNNDDHHNGEKENNLSVFCMDVRPQHSLDIEQIMGMWYGNEIIKHTQEVPGIFHINSCVVIDLSDVTQQMQASMRDYNYNNYRRTSTGTYQQQQQHQHQQQIQQQQQQQPQTDTRYLRLIWSEKDDNLEYTFNYTAAMPGLWNNVDDQRGSLVVLNKYTQFRGSVQVVKAVHDHLVLTFCGNDERSSIYSIVLSRQPEGLSSKDLRGIRNMLSRRGLSTETIHKVCSSGADSRRAWLGLLLLMFGALYVVVRKL